MARVDVFVGPMGSGKSTALCNNLVRLMLARNEVLVLKPVIDGRENINFIQTRIPDENGGFKLTNILPAIPIADCLQAAWSAISGRKLYALGIDEAQFFGNWLSSFIESLHEERPDIFLVVISALELDAWGEQFGPCIGNIMVKADNVIKLKAVCKLCGNLEATMTQRLTSSTELIVVGDKEYEPRCRKCHRPPLKTPKLDS